MDSSSASFCTHSAHTLCTYSLDSPRAIGRNFWQPSSQGQAKCYAHFALNPLLSDIFLAFGEFAREICPQGDD